jgi:histidine transporter
VLLGFHESTRVALVVGAVWLALLAGVHALWVRPHRPGPRPVAASRESGAGTPDGDLAGLEGPAGTPR